MTGVTEEQSKAGEKAIQEIMAIAGVCKGWTFRALADYVYKVMCDLEPVDKDSVMVSRDDLDSLYKAWEYGVGGNAESMERIKALLEKES